MNYTVYMHTCPNGKRYIGITCQPINRRWGNGCHYKKNQHFTNAIEKYGWENIKHEILSNSLTQDEAVIQERKYIKLFKTNDREHGYNKTTGGEKNKKLSEETRNKISQKISAIRTGTKMSEKTKEKIGNYHRGKKMSVESINKMIESRKGSKQSKEWIEKRVSKLRGRKYSQEHKQKISEMHGTKKSIYQLDISGNIIEKFDSSTDAYIFLGKSVTGNIGQCCKGTRKTAYGYIWKYAEEGS